MSTNFPLDPHRQAVRSDKANDQLLTPAEAAAYLRVSKSWLDKLRIYGGGPRFLRFGRRIFYRESELNLWADARCFGSTSEYEAGASARRPLLGKST